MKVTTEITKMIEDALLSVRYETHVAMAQSQGATHNPDILRERIISDALYLLKKPIDDFVERHFVVEIQREEINATDKA